MTAPLQVSWRGVFPAATTQFAPDLSVDLVATARVEDTLVREGVHGLVVLGTVGENNSLEPDEKRAVLTGAVETVAGRVPVITGVSEMTTARAVAYAKDAEKIGSSGLMVLPAMVYVPTTEELIAHFEAVARATRLPIMLYNNPPAYRAEITLEALARLSQLPNIVCIKESSADTRRFTDIFNALGERLFVFAGLDDVALEGLLLGARGWVSGLTNAFPAESLALWRAVEERSLERALAIYRWFMPLLHLDAGHDLVQAIKLAEEIMGRGSERVRPPRLALTGARRAAVIAMIEKAAATRPPSKAG
jgi:4-hydroxy-tetrahydrodipicolinate synthase